jgi:nucleoid-associated protein YgaU
MKRSGAVWLVVGVVVAAALLMFFVVLPQMRDGKTVQDIAKKADQAVQDVKQAVNDAGKTVEDVAKGTEEAKTVALAKMARIGLDAGKATDELVALLDKGTPTAEQVSAAKAKLAAALNEAADFKLPADADSVAAGAAAKLADGARAALAALDALPTDPAAAKAAIADLKAKLFAALPGGAALAPADATKPATDDGAAVSKPATDAETAKTASDAAKPAETAEAAKPAFDILRVEKDGSTVIAGRAQPDAKVEIVDGDKVIASTQSDPSGDFAAVLDNPLPSGDHSITLKATTKDGSSQSSEEVATVSVPKDASGDLLAMVTKPGAASKIITMPEEKPAEVATSEPATADKAPDTAADAASADQSAKPATAADAAKSETVPTETAQADAAKPADAASASTEAKTAAADAGVTTPDLAASASDIAANPPVVPADATGQTETAAADTSAAKSASTAASTDSAKTQDAKPAGTPEVMVTAVELEGDKIFVAGQTLAGAAVRIYADDQVVAEARADGDGRFVAEGVTKLAVGNHTIRADVLSADGAKVVYRASVPFFRPEGDLAAVASADAAKDAPAIEPLANGVFDKAREEAAKSMQLLKDLYADGKTPTAEELAAARSSAEIALKSLADVHVPAGVDPALADMAGKASAEAAKALERLNAVPSDAASFKAALGDVEAMIGSALKPGAQVASADEQVKPADVTKTAQATESAAATEAKTAERTVDQTKSAAADANGGVEKTDGQVSSDEVQVTTKVDRLAQSSEAKAEPGAKTETVAEPDTAAADAVAGKTDAAAADQPKVIEQAPLKQSEGSVIIRRGDTLWQISRRVYGKGVRYTTIYVANKAQITDPDRIMPGQIFTMPGKWLENSEELHKERLLHEHHKP